MTTIGIVSVATDVHARWVSQKLAERGARVHLLDMDALSRQGSLEFALDGGVGVRWRDCDGRYVDMATLDAVWLRRFIPPRAPLGMALDDRMFATREWSDLIGAVLAATPAPFVNDPHAQRDAVKPLQLTAAREAGLRVPRTLVTNDAGRVLEFVESLGGRAVHKCMGAPPHCFLRTALWDDHARACLPALRLAPTIVQERIDAEVELRVTVVGRRVLAAEFRPPRAEIDGRIDLAVEYRPHVMPQDVAHKVLGTLARLGLVFGTVDLKLTDTGEYVFLEVNPQGQFMYVEVLSGLAIADALCDFLLETASARQDRHAS